ncbi:MAG TPA: hypothetical protein VJS65_09840 [Verrucomicrobiae bacterium]|nr:hypothetical protein [Verrucomicrobiae bacterium]
MKKAAAEDFVPFDPRPESAAPPPSGPNLKVIPKTEGKPDFSPLQTPPNLSLHNSHAAPSGAGPLVTLQREGDRVTGIRIECHCGQVIELVCGY